MRQLILILVKKRGSQKKERNSRGDVYAEQRVIGELIGLHELKAIVKDDFGQVYIVDVDDLKFWEL